MNDYLILFLNTNLSIFLGLASFKFFIYFSDKSIEKFEKRLLLKISRIIFLLSIILPSIAFKLSINEKLPSLNYSQFQVFSELETSFITKQEVTKTINKTFLRDKKNLTNQFDFNFSIFLIIICGAFILFASFSRQLWQLNKLINNSVLHKKFNNYRSYFTHLIDTPFTFLNLTGPIVILPIGIITDNLTKSLALQHENQHIRQKDIHWAFFVEILKPIFWFNPTIYLWSNLLKDLSEISCDEQVIKRRKIKLREYGNCLIEVATNAINSCNKFGITKGMAYTHNSNNSFLLRRIEMLKNKTTSNGKASKLLFKTSYLLLIMISFTVFTRNQASSSLAKITTNPKIQSIVDIVLKEGIKKIGAKSGFAIVADPNSGQILGLGQLNIKNGKLIKTSTDEFLKKSFDPHSHIKTIIAAIALEKGTMHENTIIDARGGKVNIHGRNFYDWKDHGKISFINAVANSSFVGSYHMAKSIGEDSLVEGLRKFGFGKGSSVKNVSFAKNGIINMAKDDNKKFNLAYLASGMENIRVTPLELILSYASIANGGNLIQPKEFSKNQSKPEIIRRTLSKKIAERMKYVLLRTMTQGTGKWAQSSKYTIAGKTASGFTPKQKRDKNIKHKANRAQFIGFAPFNKPKLIALVILDNPEGSAHGSKHAAPVVRKILNQSLSKLGVRPDHSVSSN